MVAFYLTTMVSTLALISSQTKKKVTVKSYCTTWMPWRNQKQQWFFVLLLEAYIYILVLAVSLISSSQDWVFIDYGNGKNHKAIKLSNVNMENDFKQALVGFHPFTGNDYVSSFFTKGKTASWKRMVKDEKYI